MTEQHQQSSLNQTVILKLNTSISSELKLCLLVWLWLTLTQPQGLMWFDSGELALAAHSWGLGHPPGQPLYALLGALTTLTPWPLWVMNQISVCSIALSIPALFRIMSWIGPHDKRGEASPTWMKICLGALWACLYSVWDQGARIEVYALGSALGLWSLSTGLASTEKLNKRRRLVWISGLLLGLCGATQPLFAVGFGLAVLPLMLSNQPSLLRRLSYFGTGCLSGFLLPHFYLWWAATSSSGFVWGRWDGWSSIYFYFSGADYGLNLHSWGALFPNLLSWMKWSIAQGQLVWCGFALWGLVILKRKLVIWWSCVLGFFGMINPMTYEIYWPEVPDYSGYLLPLLSLSLLGMWHLFDRIKTPSARALTLVLLILSVCVSSSTPWSRSRRSHHLPETMARDWLEQLPHNSALFLSSDHWVFPSLYVQQIRGVRPDILIFNLGFAQSTWYWRWIKRVHPALPDLEELNPIYTGKPRITGLAEYFDAVYAENALLAAQIGSSQRWRGKRHCQSSWGVSVGCEKPLPLPSEEQLRRWAELPAHHDPMTARVLSHLGLQLAEQLWKEQNPLQALTLGFAALGQKLPTSLTLPIQWWPAPEILWQAAQGGPIASPTKLRALLNGLSGL